MKVWEWRTIAGLLWALYGLFVLVNLLGPQSVPSTNVSWLADGARSVGVPEWVLAARRFQFIVNVLVFVPVSALGGVLWWSADWRAWTAYGFVLSCAVELAQRFVLPAGRVAQFEDVVANTLGALIGALCAWLFGRLTGRRLRRLAVR